MANGRKVIIVVPVLSSLSFSEIEKLNGTTMTEKELRELADKANKGGKGFSLLSVENFVQKMNYDSSRDYFFACVSLKKKSKV